MKKLFTLIIVAFFTIANIYANHWNPNPYQYENNMTVVGIVTINGVEQNSTQLEIGAFCNDEVRGSAIGHYEQTFNRCFFYLMIYGTSNNEITFKLYDHEQMRELPATPNNSIVFSPNQMLGSIIEPYIFDFDGNIFNVTVDMNPEAAGFATGAGYYDINSTCTISAIPNPGYDFINITEDETVVSTDPTFSFTVTDDRHFTANFIIQSFDVNLSANQQIGGTVSGGGHFDYGTEITVIATPDANYSFINWTENDSVVCTTPEYCFEVHSDRNLVATFSINYFTVNATTNPSNCCNIAGAGNYIPGTMCNLVALPDKGWHFDEWIENETVIGTDEVLSFVVNENHQITGNFSLIDYEISLIPEPTEGGVLEGGGIYHFGDETCVTAIPNTHYFFDGWFIDDEFISDAHSYTFMVTESVQLTAHFHFYDLNDECFAHQFAIFPNPVDNQCNIIRNENIMQEIFIYDFSGKMVLSKKTSSYSETIDVSELSNGIYIIVIGNHRRKIVVY